jgi:hypothetical protein
MVSEEVDNKFSVKHGKKLIVFVVPNPMGTFFLFETFLARWVGRAINKRICKLKHQEMIVHKQQTCQY